MTAIIIAMHEQAIWFREYLFPNVFSFAEAEVAIADAFGAGVRA